MAMTMRERIAKRICCPSGVCQGESLGACVGLEFLGDAAAVLVELETPTDGMVEVLAWEEHPYIFRRKMDKSGYEIVEQKHPDWREVIAEPMERVFESASSDEAEAVFEKLIAAYRWSAAIRAAREGK